MKGKGDVIDRTRVYCPACRADHPGTIEQAGARIIGRTPCPSGERVVELSSDAETFRALRRTPCPSARTGGADAILVSYLDITNRCNLRCPVCYADSGREAARFLSVEEALGRVDRVRRDGTWAVTLVGGEPTVHPHLPDLVRALRRRGMRVSLASNGLRFARDPALAPTLRRAGLTKVNLQFDTFRPAVSERLRGGVFIEEKQSAARAILAAGLGLGLTTTVTRSNLSELADILRYGLSLGPRLSTFTFRVATRSGRHELEEQGVDKEQALRAVLDGKVVPGWTARDFLPVPHFAPWRLHVHPDCGVCAVLTAHPGGIRRAGEMIDFDLLWDRLARSGPGRHWVARNLRPLRHIIASTRPGARTAVLRAIRGAIRRDPRQGVVLVAVADFPRPEFWDRARSDACSAAVLTEQGRVSPCWWYGVEQARTRGTSAKPSA